MKNKVVESKKRARPVKTEPVRADKSDLMKVVDIMNTEKYIRTIDEAIRVIPDFPANGVMFRDFTTLWKNPEAYQTSISAMKLLIGEDYVNIKIAGIEARGWVYAATLADRMYRPFIPIRKHGKLPADTITAYYDTEYSGDAIEVHEDAISKEDQVVLVDDLIATGGSINAAAKCIERLGGKIVKIIALVDLEGCGGKEFLREKGYTVRTVITYPDK